MSHSAVAAASAAPSMLDTVALGVDGPAGGHSGRLAQGKHL